MGLTATFSQAQGLGCILADGDREDYELYSSHGDPCRGNGDNPPCRSFRDGKCPCYAAHHKASIDKRKGDVITRAAASIPHHDGLVGGDLTGLTTKAISDRLGVSKNEVRRLKSCGKLINGTPPRT